MTEKKPSPSRKALQVRARAKNKKPEFVRAESWRFSRFSLSWRKPRGLDNKIRRKIKGWPPGPSVGYKGPKIARGLHPSGFREVLVYNPGELSNIDVETQAIRIAHTVGKRKRNLIIEEAKKLEIKVLNMKVAVQKKDQSEEESAEAETEKAKEKEQPKKVKKEKKEKVPKKDKKPKSTKKKEKKQ